MATSLEDLRAIIAARRQSGKNYMMMETQIYAREFLYACELHARGFFGRLQFLSGAHFQDMENWAPYWAGLPPMWYATHAVAPCLALAGTRARSVRCLGSGWMRDELKRPHANPFPMETAIFDLERDEPLAMEITRALFHSARGYSESFSIYAEDAPLEAAQVHGEPPVMFKLRKLGPPFGGAGRRRRATVGHAWRRPWRVAPASVPRFCAQHIGKTAACHRRDQGRR